MKISQAEVRRLKKRVEELERREENLFNRYCTHPGVNLGLVNIDAEGWFHGRLDAAQMIGCALGARLERGELRLYAVKRP